MTGHRGLQARFGRHSAQVQPPLAPPDDDDRAAWSVAVDAFLERNIDLAQKILTEQAPRALNRACRRCGSRDGALCTRDVTCNACRGTGGFARGGVIDSWCQPCFGSGIARIAIVLPHYERISPDTDAVQRRLLEAFATHAGAERVWLAPRHIGARRERHYQATIRSLVAMGLVERTRAGGGDKQNRYVYRLTPLGYQTATHPGGKVGAWYFHPSDPQPVTPTVEPAQAAHEVL